MATDNMSDEQIAEMRARIAAHMQETIKFIDELGAIITDTTQKLQQLVERMGEHE
jgi:hypothetical protein